MESGNSWTSGSSNSATSNTNTNTSEDWRNSALVVNASKNVGSATPTVAPGARSNAGAIAIIISVFALFLGGIGLVLGLAAVSRSGEQSGEQTQIASTAGYYSGNSVEFEQTSVANIVSKVTPAVVSIITSSTQTSRGFWGYYGGTYSSQSAGTGMIVTKDGYVMTNKHVVNGANSIEIVTDSGDTYDDVTVVATDPLDDVAYLKINNVDDLPTVSLGDSKSIAVGQPVLAIGNALGAYQNSVTQGIIGGTGRSIAASDSEGRDVEQLTDLLQTDAAINPGNSGGPLVNANGDVIGINTAVSEDAQGIGFAIPISATLGMLHNIIENNNTGRAYIGVSYTTITPEVAKGNNLPVTHGAYIGGGRGSSSVVAGGPAAQAGVLDGDIITKINDVELGPAGSVATLVGEYKPGDTLKFTILRNGQEINLNITLAAYPTE